MAKILIVIIILGLLFLNGCQQNTETSFCDEYCEEWEKTHLTECICDDLTETRGEWREVINEKDLEEV